MEEIQNFGARDAGKKIFVAAGKADDFVRKHRADDNDLVVFEQQAVHVHFHRDGEKTIGKLRDFCGWDDADSLQGARIVPLVIVNVDAGVLSGALS